MRGPSVPAQAIPCCLLPRLISSWLRLALCIVFGLLHALRDPCCACRVGLPRGAWTHLDRSAACLLSESCAALRCAGAARLCRPGTPAAGRPGRPRRHLPSELQRRMLRGLPPLRLPRGPPEGARRRRPPPAVCGRAADGAPARLLRGTDRMALKGTECLLRRADRDGVERHRTRGSISGGASAAATSIIPGRHPGSEQAKWSKTVAGIARSKHQAAAAAGGASAVHPRTSRAPCSYEVTLGSRKPPGSSPMGPRRASRGHGQPFPSRPLRPLQANRGRHPRHFLILRARPFWRSARRGSDSDCCCRWAGCCRPKTVDAVDSF